MKKLLTEISRDSRLKAIELTKIRNASHIGSIFSIIDIISVLFFDRIGKSRVPLYNPKEKNFILSKGHAGLAFYIGLNQLKLLTDLELENYYTNGGKLSGHVSHYDVPGISFSTGSLGHGLPNAVGRAIVRKNKNMSPIIVLIGDGEMNEGTTWESALIASHLCLSNLLIIVDYNKMQSLDFTNDTLNLEPLKDKWIAFNFNVIEVDGHVHDELHNAFELYSNILIHNNRPTVIIANTIKGKGVSFMENNIKYHYSPIRDENELEIAIKEIRNNAR